MTQGPKSDKTWTAPVLETERLIIRRMDTGDAEFMLELVNEPSYIRYIGDRGVRTVDDARRFVLDGPVASYGANGFGLYIVELKSSGTPIGISGLIKRPSLDDVDVGFAFLPEYRSKGYAYESSAAVMQYARDVLGLERIVAIVTPDNESSIKLLGKLGLEYERTVRLGGDDTHLLLLGPRRGG